MCPRVPRRVLGADDRRCARGCRRAAEEGATAVAVHGRRMIPCQRRSTVISRRDRRDFDLLVARLEAAAALGFAQLPGIGKTIRSPAAQTCTGRSSTSVVWAARASPVSRAKVGVLIAPCIRIRPRPMMPLPICPGSSRRRTRDRRSESRRARRKQSDDPQCRFRAGPFHHHQGDDLQPGVPSRVERQRPRTSTHGTVAALAAS